MMQFALPLGVAIPMLGVGVLLALESPRVWRWVGAVFAALDVIWCLAWATSSTIQSGVAAALAVNALIALAVELGQPPRGLVRRDAALPLVWLAASALVMAADDARLVMVGWLAPPVIVALSLRAVSERERRARTVVWRTLMLGSLPLLVGAGLFVNAGFQSGASAPYLISQWNASWLSSTMAGAVFLLVAVSVMARLGVPPFHAWLPTLSEVLPAGTMLSLTAVQMAVHVMVRLALAPLPNALPSERLLVLGLGLFGVVWASVVAASEHRLKRVIAFVTSAQSGALLAGLALGEVVGMSGVMTNAISVALTMRGLMLLASVIEARVGPVDTRQFTGLAHSAPRLAAVALMLTLAAAGIPGSLGFVGEDLLLQGLVHEHPVLAGILVVCTAITGFALLRSMLKTCFGPGKPWHAAVPDLFPRERVLLVLAFSLLVLGVFPAPLVRAHHADVEVLLQSKTSP